jgi:hypothetical protein
LKTRPEIPRYLRHIIAPDHSFFCAGQCRKGDGSGGGTIFDAEFAQDVFDVLADRTQFYVLHKYGNLRKSVTSCSPGSFPSVGPCGDIQDTRNDKKN